MSPADQQGAAPAKRSVSVRYQDSQVVEAYDRRRFYSLSGRYKNWRLHSMLARVLTMVPPGGVVLDMPCGTGRIENWLLEAPVRVIAADISAEMLAMARQKTRTDAGRVGFMRTDAGRLPFRSGSIEIVFSIRFFHLIDQQTRLAVLTELARVAKRGVVVEYRRVDTPMKAVRRAVQGWLTGRTQQIMTPSTIAEEFGKCGLVIEEQWYPSRWFSGSVVVRARHQDARPS